MPLHQFIAKGGKPKDYVGSQGINASTVNNCGTTKKVMPKPKKK